MKLFFKSIFFLAITALVLGGCKQSILDDENGGATNNNNIRLRVLPYWNNYFFSSDSIYSANGSLLQIDDIRVLHSNFTFVDQGDSLESAAPFEWRLGKGSDLLVYSLPAGSYSGFFYFNVGLDSLQDAFPPQFYPEGSVLADGSLYRGTQLGGYNYVVISGRIVNPGDPLAGPSIPMSWVVATQDLKMTYIAGKSFNVVPGKFVTIEVKFDVAKLFTALFPLGTPIIASNPQNSNDFNQATILKQNFNQEAYRIQL